MHYRYCPPSFWLPSSTAANGAKASGKARHGPNTFVGPPIGTTSLVCYNTSPRTEVLHEQDGNNTITVSHSPSHTARSLWYCRAVSAPYLGSNARTRRRKHPTAGIHVQQSTWRCVVLISRSPCASRARSMGKKGSKNVVRVHMKTSEDLDKQS